MEVGFRVSRVWRFRNRNIYVLDLDEPLDVLSRFTDVAVEINGKILEATYYYSSRPKLIVISNNGIEKRGAIRLIEIKNEYNPHDDWW